MAFEGVGERQRLERETGMDRAPAACGAEPRLREGEYRGTVGSSRNGTARRPRLPGWFRSRFHTRPAPRAATDTWLPTAWRILNQEEHLAGIHATVRDPNRLG